MDAKQTLSASLVGLLCVASPAVGDDDAQPAGEVQPKTETLQMRRPTGTFAVGAGYATDDGFLLGMRIAQPSLMRGDKGIALSATITERWNEIALRYDDPTLFDTDLRLRTDLFQRGKQFTRFEREGIGGELTLTKPVAPHLELFGGYKLEHVTVVGTDEIATRAAGIPATTDFRVGALRLGMQYATVGAHDFYPRRGTILGTSLEYADQQLGSEVNYLRVDTWFARHQPLGPFTLHLGGRVRGLVDRLADIPISERLHFDGSSDVRGYAPGSIRATGGNLQWTARAELETPSWQGISLAGFADAGGLYGDGEGYEIASVGFGVIWRSPLGPMRFDWAKPLVGETDDLRFVFGLGGAF